MGDYIRYSLFGNFSEYSTSNARKYIDLINFFDERKFECTIVNELKLNEDGENSILSMPAFKFKNVLFEIGSNRINLEVNFTENMKYKEGLEQMKSYLQDLLVPFSEKNSLQVNRTALNVLVTCNCKSLTQEDDRETFDLYSKTTKKCYKDTILNKESNIIITEEKKYKQSVCSVKLDLNTNPDGNIIPEKLEYFYEFNKISEKILEGYINE